MSGSSESRIRPRKAAPFGQGPAGATRGVRGGLGLGLGLGAFNGIAGLGIWNGQRLYGGHHRGVTHGHLGLGLHTYYRTVYDRYAYSRPYIPYYARYGHHGHDFDDYYYGGYVSLGYSSGYGSYGIGHLYPANNYYSSTTVYETEPVVVYQTDAVDPVPSDAGVVYGEIPPAAPDPAYGPPPPVGGPVTGTPDPSAPITEPGTAGEPAKPTLIDEGNAAFNAGEYQTAVRYYVSAVLAGDNDAFARLFYGLAQFALGDYELAAMGMRRALAIAPELIERPVDFRSIYPDLATFDRHLNKLVAYVAEHPTDKAALFLLSYVYFASAQPDLALPTARVLADLDPEDKLAGKVRDAAAGVLEQAPRTP